MFVTQGRPSVKWRGLGGGRLELFPIVCHYDIKLYERLELMVSFDEIWPIIKPELWNEIKDDWVHYHWHRWINFGVSPVGGGGLPTETYNITWHMKWVF